MGVGCDGGSRLGQRPCGVGVLVEVGDEEVDPEAGFPHDVCGRRRRKNQVRVGDAADLRGKRRRGTDHRNSIAGRVQPIEVERSRIRGDGVAGALVSPAGVPEIVEDRLVDRLPEVEVHRCGSGV